MTRALPRVQVLLNGQHHGKFFWDSRILQLRKVDNPHVYFDVSWPTAACLDDLAVGETHTVEEFSYRRLS